jgi:hypothetical protein
MILWIKILTTLGSIVTIGFGIWHFFVPKIWNWYSYIDETATELIVAIRAINIFFSLSLVLLGIINLLFLYKNPQDRFALIVMLGASIVLWCTRCVLQIIYPQGSQNQVLQYSMLAIFIIVLLCFVISLIFVLGNKNV